MKLPIKILVVLLVLGAIGTGFYVYKQKKAKKEVNLEVIYPVLEDIVQTITATGRLQPIDQVDIGTEVSGTVSKIYTDFNQNVTKGQVLLEIDPQKAKAKVEQTKAAYRSAVNETQYQKRNYDRISELFQKGSVAATDLETAEYRYKNAQSSLTSARSNLEQAELDLQNCIIKSPIDGIVLNRAVEAGQTVAASLSAPTLFTLARDLTQMEVKADVDEADIGQVKTGQRVEFSVDAFPSDKFSGEVQEVRLSPNILSNVVTYTVIIRASNPNQKLLPGMTANCEIVVEEALQVLTIPMRALQFKPDQNTPGYTPQSTEEPTKREGSGKRADNKNRGRVWVLGSGGALQVQRVNLGISDGAKIQVLDGLESNTPVAIGVQSTSTEKSNQTTNPFMPQRKQGTKTRM
ncbi:MAG: efflux RND transporter periplasmic adaptor subunit [Candidatus Fibromonas sp.]|jgi:HlyD family secretion protein|nr:efflux RND transporter periplasmic adaptor subunit [Candidatus Fibromonas sp.]